MMKPRITYLMFVYNEAGRVGEILRHATFWADEVLVFDKQSTDATREICLRFGPKVRVIETPFSLQGHEDMVSAFSRATHDWVWVGTASEIPTRKLVGEARRILDERPELDLVYVPRKVYSFGFHSTKSPWAVIHYPFLLNRRRAVVSNTIHQNFRPTDRSNTARIAYAEDCCVHHFTHTTAASYLSAMTQYFEAEIKRPNPGEVIQECLENLEKRPDLRSIEGTDQFGLECAWRLYWVGTGLFAWDKRRGADAAKVYREARAALIQAEWPGTETGNGAESASGQGAGIKSPAANTPGATVSAASSAVEDVLGSSVAGAVWQGGRSVRSEDQMLQSLRGRPISKLVRTLYQVGAHRFQEKDLFFELFPNLERVCLFEPLPELFEFLRQREAGDPRVTVLPYAVSDTDGEAVLNVASNDAASSSLLDFGEHRDLFPEVGMTGKIRVATRTLESAMAQHQLPPPDLLFLDVQGAEHKVLSAIGPGLRARMKLIYTEASLVEVYAGSKPLDELKRLLAPEFLFLGYCPLVEKVATHGNALFAHQNHAWLVPSSDAPAQAPPSPVSSKAWDSWWAKALRAVLSRKLRRSVRKRIASLSDGLAD